MALSINSTLKELVTDPRAKAILEDMKVDNGQTNPGWTDDPQFAPAMGMSLVQLAGYVPDKVSAEEMQRVDGELGKL